MSRLSLSLHHIIALILLAIVAFTCVALGNWQLDRAAQREAILSSIRAGQARAPLMLTPRTPEGEMQDWRPALATGTWRNDLTVLLMNRNLNGVSGFWVATPLVLNEDSSAVLVLRGWVARPLGPGETLPALDAPAGLQTVEGQLVGHVPRLYELPTFGDAKDPSALPPDFPDSRSTPPQVQNLALQDYAQVTGLKLLPVVLEQTSSRAEGGQTTLAYQWPLPSVDADQNRGYALQWFGFASIAGIAWLVIAWRLVRRPRQRTTPRH